MCMKSRDLKIMYFVKFLDEIPGTDVLTYL